MCDAKVKFLAGNVNESVEHFKIFKQERREAVDVTTKELKAVIQEYPPRTCWDRTWTVNARAPSPSHSHEKKFKRRC